MQEPPRRSRLDVYKGWHREPSFYREVYARSVSAALVGLLGIALASAFGIISRKPLAYFSIGILVFSVGWFVYGFAQARKVQKLEKSSTASREEVEFYDRRVRRLLVANAILFTIFAVVTTVLGL
ncbi:hypothetical protein GCM10022197_17680 [Microlunatus spumicola]|uniref:DUF202 domain-containing protein n=1 Tax=Microlunatus spumicola TaxID=81499 RepID=A0ABP6X7W7_9ACTN